MFEAQISECLASEVVEHAHARGVCRYRTLLLALQPVLRRRSVGAVETPCGGRHVDSRAVSNAVLVNPYFVLVGGKPRGVAPDCLSRHVERRRCSLIVNLEVEPVFPGRNGEALRHAELQLAVEHHIEVTLTFYLYCLRLVEPHRGREFHRHPVAVLFPERRKHCPTLSAAVVEAVAQPHLEVAGIPYPLCLRCCLHIARVFQEFFPGASVPIQSRFYYS